LLVFAGGRPLNFPSSRISGGQRPGIERAPSPLFPDYGSRQLPHCSFPDRQMRWFPFFPPVVILIASRCSWCGGRAVSKPGFTRMQSVPGMLISLLPRSLLPSLSPPSQQLSYRIVLTFLQKRLPPIFFLRVGLRCSSALSEATHSCFR